MALGRGVAGSPKVSAGERVKGAMAKLPSISKDERQTVGSIC